MKPAFTIIILGLTTFVAVMAASLLYEPTVTWSDAVRPPRCAVTLGNTRLLPGIFGPVVGNSPVWFVSGSTGVWSTPAPVKSIWILSREAAGHLRLEGHRLDGLGDVQFQRGVNGDIVGTMDIADPWRDSMRPGGPSITERYAFVATYIYYPSAGCWELIARVGDREVRVVTLLKTTVAALDPRAPFR